MGGRREDQDAYVTKMRNLGHKDIHCQVTGLMLLPHHSYSGGSSDGVILNHQHHKEKGALEIKCPYSIEKKSHLQSAIDSNSTSFPSTVLSGRH